MLNEMGEANPATPEFGKQLLGMTSLPPTNRTRNKFARAYAPLLVLVLLCDAVSLKIVYRGEYFCQTVTDAELLTNTSEYVDSVQCRIGTLHPGERELDLSKAICCRQKKKQVLGGQCTDLLLFLCYRECAGDCDWCNSYAQSAIDAGCLFRFETGRMSCQSIVAWCGDGYLLAICLTM